MALISRNWMAPVSGDWLTAANWTPGGVPSASTVATIAVGGTYDVTIGNGAVAHALFIRDAGATVTDTGSLGLHGALDIAAGDFTLDYGTLTGATVVTGAGAMFLDEGGTLASSAVRGTLTIGAGAFANLNAVTFAGAGGRGLGEIDATASGGNIVLSGTTTLDNAIVKLGSVQSGISGFTGSSISDFTLNATLTLGTNLTIDQAGLQAAIGSSGALVIDGTINADTAGGVLSLSSQGALVNHGHITVSNGATLVLQNADTALIDSIVTKGGTLEIAASVTGGTIVSATSDVALGGGGILSGVTVDGTLTINSARSDPDASILNGITFAGVGGTGNGVLDFAGTSYQTSPGQFMISSTAGLDDVTINIGYVADIFITRPSGTFTLGTHAVLNNGIATQLYTDGTLVNAGTINVAQASADVLIGARSFVNEGAINVSGGGTLDVAGAGSAAFIAGVDVSNGTLVLHNDFNIAIALSLQAAETVLLEGGGTLTADIAGAGTLSLNGSGLTIGKGASVEATLAIYTQVTLAAGIEFALGAGHTWLDFGTITGPVGSSVTIDGTDLGGGSFGVQVLDAGVINVGVGQGVTFGQNNAATVITGTLTGAGAAYVTGTAGLQVLAGAQFDVDQLIQAAGSVTLGKSVTHTVTAQQSWLLEDARLGGTTGSAFVNDGLFSSVGTATSAVTMAFVNAAQVKAGSGTLQFLGAMTNSGTIAVAGGNLIVTGSLLGAGVVDIGAPVVGHGSPLGGAAELHAIAAGQMVDFLTPTGTLLLDQPDRALGTIADFTAGDSITLANSQETSFKYAGGVLSILDGTATVARLHFSGGYTQQSFVVGDSGGAVVITHS